MKNKSVFKFFTILIFSITILLFQNCGQYQTSSSLKNSSLTENPIFVEVDKRPLLSCVLSNSAGRVYRRISNISNSDEMSASITEGEQITFDCSDSMDYKGTYNITDYSVNFGSGFISNQNGIYNQTYRVAGTYEVNFRLRDNEGNELNKLVRILVKCSTATPSTLSISASEIRVENHSVIGFFTYSAAGAVSGGKAPYNYAWDFNGDSIIDHQPVDNRYQDWQVWSDRSTTIPVHNLYTNSRRIVLTVKDACNFTRSIEKDVMIDLPRIASEEFPTQKGYFYVQADIVRTSALHAKNSINKATNVDLNSIQSVDAPDRSEIKHVECGYQRDTGVNFGRLWVTGLNTYGNSQSEGANHGISLSVNDISDAGSLGIVADRVSKPIERASYFIAQSAEVMSSYTFSGEEACPMTIKLERIPTSTPCESDPNIQKTLIVMTGSGSCAGLSNNYAGTVSANNVKFYCELYENTMCPQSTNPGPTPPRGY